MDRSWMRASRITAEYGPGVEQFLQFTEMHAPSLRGKYFCPCVKCANGRHQTLSEIRSHLICHGMIPNYTNWIWHGELPDNPTLSHTEAIDVDMGCRIEEMIRDLGQDGFRQAHAPLYDKIENDSKTPVYSGCTTFTRLSAVLALVNLKARFGWSDKSFTELLVLLKKLLPEDNTLPKSQYEAKKILCPVGMEYQKIHACPNDCILYRNEYAKMRTCPTCGVSRYKVNNHEESDVATAENSHPTKAFDALYPDFGNETRNLRLGLAFDGMNPFGNLSTSHSSWPVLLMIYNLPPWLCMKRKYIMLCMMIAGPRQPGNDINVYLTPLIEDLRTMWEHGVDVWDENLQETFRLRAMVLCTINDFPAYGNLSGYSVKGHHACPICEKNTSFVQLKHGKKTIYTRHRRFLNQFRPYRRLKKAFNGSQENESAPKPLNGKEVHDRVNDIITIFGKTQKKTSSETNI
eukprot:XP_006582699.1 uncharacterized protein LOC102669134 [Glycine max]